MHVHLVIVLLVKLVHLRVLGTMRKSMGPDHLTIITLLLLMLLLLLSLLMMVHLMLHLLMGWLLVWMMLLMRMVAAHLSMSSLHRVLVRMTHVRLSHVLINTCLLIVLMMVHGQRWLLVWVISEGSSLIVVLLHLLLWWVRSLLLRMKVWLPLSVLLWGLMLLIASHLCLVHLGWIDICLRQVLIFSTLRSLIAKVSLMIPRMLIGIERSTWPLVLALHLL